VSLFRAHLRLQRDGVLEMVDDEPLGVLEMEPEVFRPPFWVIGRKVAVKSDKRKES
jgi:hypothetical protein